MGQRTHFAPASADEDVVYGACRPGYFSSMDPNEAVADWIEQMLDAGVERICCLLESDELELYDDLLSRYEMAFGKQAVRHVPIADYTPIGPGTFRNELLPFLRSADSNSAAVVVHCSAGIGRTEQVLVLWLVFERGYGLDEAIRKVEATGRRPLEAAHRNQLRAILTD